MFVSEGNPEDKVEAIKHSAYLNFAIENLQKSDKSLVIYGTSLSSPDFHIVDAINHNNNSRKLAISIYSAEETVDETREEIKRLRDMFVNHKIKFFNPNTLFEF